MASRGLLVPSSYVPYVFNFAAALSIVPIVAGTVALTNPRTGLELLQFKSPRNTGDSLATTQESRTTDGLVRMYAVRQAFMGFVQLAMWSTGSQQALALSSIASTAVAVIDGWVAKSVTGTNVAGHWIGAGMGSIMALILLRVL